MNEIENSMHKYRADEKKMRKKKKNNSRRSTNKANKKIKHQ